MRKCDAWATAVVYLLDKTIGHYKNITKYILDSDLTILGGKGNTPDHTIGSMLCNKAIDGQNVFKSLGRGRYGLLNPEEIQDHESVQLLMFEQLT
jgi:hypothetical protein